MKEPGLERMLFVDAHPRAAFIDHFYAAGTGVTELIEGTAAELGDFAGSAYEISSVEEADEGPTVTLRRTGIVAGREVSVTKSITLDRGERDTDGVTVSYVISVADLVAAGVGAAESALGHLPADALFAPEVNLTLLAGWARDRYVLVDDARPSASFLADSGTHADASSVTLVDESGGLRLRLSWRFGAPQATGDAAPSPAAHGAQAWSPDWAAAEAPRRAAPIQARPRRAGQAGPRDPLSTRGDHGLAERGRLRAHLPEHGPGAVWTHPPRSRSQPARGPTTGREWTVNGPLDVAFVWHMHQPYYRISDSGAFEMPWVRLHAVKDYIPMIEILEGYPELRQTFNLVPSLVEQLLEYATGRYVDTYEEHARKPAAELSRSEKSFLLGTMCERSFHPRARRYPRYLELALKRDGCTTDGRVRVAEFSEGELRDVQVLFDLAWFHPTCLSDGPLAELAARGRDFTESDKSTVAAAQAALLARVVPMYVRAAAAGHIELTTSPYFHPILPLLMNSDMARVSLPSVELPTRRFDHPEDADEQIREALRLHQRVFGGLPRGMWCSEQSVGEDVIAPLSDHGISWTISDEAVLAHSLEVDLHREAGGRLLDPSVLYSTYRLERERGAIDIVFRDRTLSDLVGFTYQDWDSADAAADLLARLTQIRVDLPSDDAPYLVTIALDGENAWEYYKNEGHDFLGRLYEGIEHDPALRCVTVSEHLNESPPKRELAWLHTGSWIRGDLGTWVGDRAHRPAWDLLHDARDAVAGVRARVGATAAVTAGVVGGAPNEAHAGARVAASNEGPTPAPVGAHPEAPYAEAPAVEAAWREILIAEGSDWFWWFGDHQESGLDEVWDAAYRRHLQQAYRLAGLNPPARLFAPVAGGPPETAAGLTPVVVDGRFTTPEEWDQGIRLTRAGGGVMQRAESPPVLELRCSWSPEGLYFLVVPRVPFPEARVEVDFYLGGSEEPAGGGATGHRVPVVPASEAAAVFVATLGFTPTHRVRVVLTAEEDGLSATAVLSRAPFEERTEGVTIATDEVIEVQVDWTAIDIGGTGPLFIGSSTVGRWAHPRRVPFHRRGGAASALRSCSLGGELPQIVVLAHHHEDRVLFYDVHRLGRGQDLGPTFECEYRDPILGPDAEFSQRAADEFLGRRDLHDGVVGAELEVVDDVRTHEAVRRPDTHIALGKEDAVGAHLSEDSAVHVVDRPRHHAGCAGFLECQRDEDRILQPLPDAHYGDVEIAEAQALEYRRICGVGHHHVQQVIAERLDPILVDVDAEHLFTQLGQGLSHTGAETAEADHNELAAHA